MSGWVWMRRTRFWKFQPSLAKLKGEWRTKMMHHSCWHPPDKLSYLLLDRDQSSTTTTATYHLESCWFLLRKRRWPLATSHDVTIPCYHGCVFVFFFSILLTGSRNRNVHQTRQCPLPIDHWGWLWIFSPSPTDHCSGGLPVNKLSWDGWDIGI